jgi:hypothetical protein
MNHQICLKYMTTVIANTSLLSVISFGIINNQVQAAAIDNVASSEISSYTKIYQLPIPTIANYTNSSPSYTQDNSSLVFSEGIGRIAYYMELTSAKFGSQWLWVSMDAFTQNLKAISVPIGSIKWQQKIDNMNVESNVGSIIKGTGITTGNIEFWSQCYYQSGGNPNIPQGNNSLQDFNDTPWLSQNCYGSMQVHNYAVPQTLFAWNAWVAQNSWGYTGELGIGNQLGGSGQPDWTYSNNAAQYSVKNLEVWVKPKNYISSERVPESSNVLGLGLLGLGLAATKIKGILSKKAKSLTNEHQETDS